MQGNAMLKTTLITCAHASVRNKKSYFYAPFMRISAHRGKKRAYVAVAHSMLIAIYHILKDGVVFKDLGADYYNQFNKERKINAYLKKLKALSWEAPAAATQAYLQSSQGIIYQARRNLAVLIFTFLATLRGWFHSKTSHTIGSV